MGIAIKTFHSPQIIAIACLVLSLVSATPLPGPDPANSEVGGNDLFQQINDIIKRGIDSQIHSNDSVEIGEKIKADDGSIKIVVNEFTAQNKFPVRFRVHHTDAQAALEDKTIVPIVDDFDGSSEYVLKKTSSSEESSEEDKSPKKSTTAKSLSPTSLRPTGSSSSATSPSTTTASSSTKQI